MKKVALVLGLLLIGFFLFSFGLKAFRGKIRSDFTQSLPQIVKPSPSIPPIIQAGKITKSLFVPYWSIANKRIETDGYDTIIYFGITPTVSGIDTAEPGYKNIGQLSKNLDPTVKKLLTLRMIDSDTNLAILKNKAAQEVIIAETIALAKEHAFAGIVLDLELQALPFDSLLQQINTFTKDFYETAKVDHLHFAITLYGDTFYRIRPFDVKALVGNTDEVMIMAYDFHKSGGNPGPNFPLSGKEEFGYDYKAMLSDFRKYTPAGKITIIYGMFGYDWEVNEKGKAQTVAKPLSLHQIQEKIIDNCSSLRCNVIRDERSSEMTIHYVATDGKRHVVWFEDEVSVKAKKDFSTLQGISHFSFWAYSYF